jgi:chemotaxis family two-component system response regulator Rcp1
MRARGADISILLVEDDPDHVDLTRIALQTARVPFGLDVVMDGTEALQYLRREAPYEMSSAPDLILLDLNLPKLDGREVLRAIKSDAELRRIPVIVLTTSSDIADIENAYENHANSFITKPTDFDEFLHAIETMHEYWLSVVRLPG